MTINNKLYDRLKWVVQILLPGLATFIFAVTSIWGLDFGDKIVGTFAALTTFLGVVIGISNTRYLSDENNFDGDLYISESSVGLPDIHAALNENPSILRDKAFVTMRIMTTELEAEPPPG